MTQIARPIADISNSGWSPVPFNPQTPLYSQIDEPVADDTDFVTTVNDPTGARFEVRLRKLSWPKSGPQILKVRLKRTGTVDDGILTKVQLRQGAKVIAARSILDPATNYNDGEDEFTIELSEAEKALITDYTDLRVSVTAGAVTLGCCGLADGAALNPEVDLGSTGCSCFPSGWWGLNWSAVSGYWVAGSTWSCSGEGWVFHIKCDSNVLYARVGATAFGGGYEWITDWTATSLVECCDGDYSTASFALPVEDCDASGSGSTANFKVRWDCEE